MAGKRQQLLQYFVKKEQNEEHQFLTIKPKHCTESERFVIL